MPDRATIVKIGHHSFQILSFLTWFEFKNHDNFICSINIIHEEFIHHYTYGGGILSAGGRTNSIKEGFPSTTFIRATCFTGIPFVPLYDMTPVLP